jgi:hypothetical protein
MLMALYFNDCTNWHLLDYLKCLNGQDGSEKENSGDEKFVNGAFEYQYVFTLEQLLAEGKIFFVVLQVPARPFLNVRSV